MPIDDFTYRALPFLEAIQFLRRKLNLPTTGFRDLMGEKNDVAFAVAGAMKAGLLKDLRDAVDQALAEGTTLETFRAAFDEIVERYGWGYRGGRNWRTRIIYQTNLTTAHAAGRYRQMTDPDVQARRPYWRYRHGGSSEPREKHVQSPPSGFNGLVLPADDPFWDTHYPPNGWGCSCFVETLSDADLEREGLAVDAAPAVETYEHTNPITGEVEEVPQGIDPGWDYAPGRSPRTDQKAILRRTVAELPPDIKDQARREIEQHLGPLDDD